MRKWLVFILLLGLLCFPSQANAQTEPRLKNLNIQLWAEYDQPTMLVIHEFTVDESVTLPANVKVRFPKGSNLTAVASLDNGTLINTIYEGPDTQGEWQIVTLKVESYAPHRIEYYQPISRDGNKREFSFRWFGDYQADQFIITLQLPADSTNVLTDPVLDNLGASSDGTHLVGVLSRSAVKMGQSSEFKVEYERTTETVSQSGAVSTIQPSEPISADTEGRVSIDNLPWIIGGFGLVLIALALIFYWRSTQAPERKPRRRSHSGNGQEDPGQAYCHECGTRANSGDRFCRTCGSRLRV